MNQNVPAHVPPGARLLIIGQAPGRTEASKGKPFVGVDGLQLRSWLRAVNIDPDAAAYDNIHQGYSGDPTYKPTAKEVKAGHARLLSLLENLRPEVVLLVGAVACHFRFKGTMAAMNGRRETSAFPIDTPENGTVTYVGVYHPGAFRNAGIHGSRGAAQAIEADILSALRQVAALLSGDEQAGVTLPDDGVYVENLVLPAPGNGNFFPWGPLAIDVETCGDTKDPRKAEFVLAAVANDLVKNITFEKPAIFPGAKLLVHNVPYDGIVLGTWDAEWDDTKMLAHMMGEQDTTLKGLALRYLDHPMLSYTEAERLGVLPEYCLDDAQTTYKLFPVLRDCMDASVLALYEMLEKPLFPLWHKMSIEGSFYLHHEALREYQWELAEKVGGLLLEVQDALPRGRDVKRCSVCGTRSAVKGQRCDTGGHHKWAVEWLGDEPVNLNSPVHQLLPALQALGIPVSSTGADNLELYAARYPVLRTLLDYRAAFKEDSTYVSPWCAIPEGTRLGAIWNPHGTWTMRASSRGPNMQNVPLALERFFHAGPGYTLLTLDHAQLEVRTCAHLSGDPNMIEACRSEDVHGTFQQMLGITEGRWGLTKEYARRLTKVFVFRGLYADPDSDDPGSFMDAARAAGVDIAFDDALEGVRVLHDRFGDYYEWAREVRNLRIVPGLFGMKHHVPPGDEYHQQLEAVNAGPQGGGALVTKFGMLALHRAGYEVVRQVHDSVTIRVRDQDVEDARVDAAHLMETAIPTPLLVPLRVEVK